MQQLLQLLSAIGLHRRLSDQAFAHREGREQLVIQIVTIGQHHQCRVGHGRMLDQLAGVEGHQQTFARALGMPYHACALVSGPLCLDTGQTVPGGIFGHTLNDPCSPNRGSHRMAYCMELVIARNDLGKPRPRRGKHGETANQLKQTAVLKHPFDQRGKFRFPFRRNLRAVGGPPRHEALQIRRERTHTGTNPIRSDQQRIGVKERRNLGLVRLKLLEGPSQVCTCATRRLQLDHPHRQAIQEHDHIRPPTVLATDNRELAHRQPVIVLRLLKIDQPDLSRRQRTVVSVILHIHAFGHQLVEPAVLFQQ